MSLASYVQIVARGQGRARPLTLNEARKAFALILRKDADPEAVGALLMVLRLRGEVPAEIAGFTLALRDHLRGQIAPADLDWPVYAAGRTRGVPLFLLAARLVGQAGFTVCMHGWSQQDTLRHALAFAGPSVRYHPLETLAPAAFDLLRLRDILGLRSCVNTVLRMWNPSSARASVQGVFHPSYRGLQAQAAELMGDQTLTIIKGGGGEFERHPGKQIMLFGLRGGTHIAQAAPALQATQRRLHQPDHHFDLNKLWQGQDTDPFAIATITGTAALALWTLKATPDLAAAQTLADALWATRHSNESLSA